LGNFEAPKKGIRLGGHALPRFHGAQVLGQIFGFLILHGALGDPPGNGIVMAL
jgi:hypothetical protein